MQFSPAALGWGATAAYAAGSFGTGVFVTVPTILLLYFCTEILKLPVQWAMGIVFVPKVWSMLWDPFVGNWSDRTSTALGRRRPFLIAGTVGVTLSFIALFSPPAVGVANIAMWVAIAYFLLATLYSLFSVPYVALPAEIGGGRDGRTRLVSWRMLVAMLGILTGAGVVPLLVQAFGGGRRGYSSMSLWVAGACALAMTGPVVMLRGRDCRSGALVAGSPRALRALWSALTERTFAWLSCAYLVQLTAVGMISAVTPYLVTKAFGQGEGAIGTAMLMMLAVTTVTIPAWSWAGRRFGETRSLGIAVLGYASLTVSLGALVIVHAPWPAVLVVYALLGCPLAGMQVLPYALLAHLIHTQGERHGNAAGSFTGMWTAIEKLGLALGPSFVALALWLSASSGARPLGVLTLIGPAVLALASLPVLRRAE